MNIISFTCTVGKEPLVWRKWVKAIQSRRHGKFRGLLRKTTNDIIPTIFVDREHCLEFGTDEYFGATATALCGTIRHDTALRIVPNTLKSFFWVGLLENRVDKLENLFDESHATPVAYASHHLNAPLDICRVSFHCSTRNVQIWSYIDILLLWKWVTSVMLLVHSGSLYRYRWVFAIEKGRE